MQLGLPPSWITVLVSASYDRMTHSHRFAELAEHEKAFCYALSGA